MTTHLLPQPNLVRRGPPLKLGSNANVVDGTASPRLRRAVDRLPPLELRFAFAIAEAPREVPALDDSYAYRLRLAETTANVQADTEWGALAALATLAQLATEESIDVAEVRDAPQFPWRGLMLDTARHFLSTAAIKRTLDAMWFYKLNVLHLHLTDDQGFRVRFEAHPELASADAYAASELRDLVAYAADRGIRVVPELDVPGHTTSWLAAHPEWAFPCEGQAPRAPRLRALSCERHVAPSRRFGVHRTCIDPRNPQVLAAVDALFGELADVFPDDFLHFGGDEATALDAATQADFNARLVRLLMELGKRPLGWDECLHPDLPTGTTVQAWRGLAARDVALQAGFDCVVSAPYYLDLFFPASAHAVAPTASAAEVAAASDDPRLAHVRQGIDWMAGFANVPTLPTRGHEAGKVLGGEACMWSELVTEDLLDTRVWSRMPAIAAQFWGEAADAPYLVSRMTNTRHTLARLGVVAEDRAVLDAYPALAPLIEMLEPVKWYRRLLGDAAFRARVSGLGSGDEERPYDVDSPLDRIVDRIAPESLASRRAEADLARGADMTQWIAGWRAQREALDDHPELLPELCAVSDALLAVADLVAGSGDANPADLAGPFGEYLLPIAYALDER